MNGPVRFSYCTCAAMIGYNNFAVISRGGMRPPLWTVLFLDMINFLALGGLLQMNKIFHRGGEKFGKGTCLSLNR